MTLSLSLGNSVVYSAYRLTERNIWLKFNENCSKLSGAMERTLKCNGRND